MLSLATASRRWFTFTVAAPLLLHTLLALLTRSWIRSSRHFDISTGAVLETLPTSCPPPASAGDPTGEVSSA